jgi:hypothetical protein
MNMAAHHRRSTAFAVAKKVAIEARIKNSMSLMVLNSSALASRTFDGMSQRNLDTPDVTFDRYAVRLERLLCRATQHRSRPYVELRTM